MGLMRTRTYATTLSRMGTILLGALALSVGCGDTDSTPDGAGGSGGAGGAGGAAPATPSTRGDRYCEVLIASLAGGSVDVEVWGTQGLNSCPAEDWATVDADAIKTELSATAVILNGPRYWVIDGFSGNIPDVPPRTFGTLEMHQLATISLAPGSLSSMPYAERTIMRDSEFEFRAGSEVYELVATDGSIYVMQSYAQIVDATLSEGDLPGLGTRLMLPSGWTYRARTLDADLHVSTPGQATVVQDELQNTYTKLPPQ